MVDTNGIARMIEPSLGAMGYRVVRYWNNEVIENMEGVLETLVAILRSGATPHPER